MQYLKGNIFSLLLKDQFVYLSERKKSAGQANQDSRGQGEKPFGSKIASSRKNNAEANPPEMQSSEPNVAKPGQTRRHPTSQMTSQPSVIGKHEYHR